ncbi:tetratricopeptide repeat protein [Labilibacter sediminis]|nr:tetratricopeptide repeat protein [Labilibacter sediminis]
MDIFLSYNWNNKLEADTIEKNLSSIGINIKRDINDIKYKDDLRSFMSQITETDYALILISNDYLKSPNCLFELTELSKDKNYERKFLPIIVDGASLYSIEDKMELIQYWETKCSEVENLIKTVSPTNAINLIHELKLYKNILASLDDFLQNITRRLNVKYSDSLKTNFKEVLEFIGYDLNSIQKQLLEIRNIEDSHLKELKLDNLGKEYPNNKDVLFTIGYVNLTEIKNYHKAKFSFKKYIDEFDSNSYLACNNLGLACQNLSEKDLADKYYKQGLLLNKNAYQILHNLGNLEASNGNYELAKEYFLRTIEIYPNDAETFYNLAKIYTDFLHDFNLGEKYYWKSIQLEPDFFMAYNNLASIYLRLQNFDRAIELLEQGLEQNPNDYVTHYNLGMLYFNYKKDHIKAKKLFRNSIRLNNNYISAKIGMAKLLILQAQDYHEAEDILLDAYKIEPENKDVLAHLSTVYNLLGDEKKSKEFESKVN